MADFDIGIVGCSHVLPKAVQTNEALCEFLPDTTPDWIVSKTGIKRRYIVGEDESASSLALQACQNLVLSSNVEIGKIGLVIVASFSQDYLFPPLSAKLHSDLKLSKDCQIIDINTNCVGLVTALSMGSERMLYDGSIEYALIVGVEVLSRFTDKLDRDTAVFFSDGAAAVMLGKVKKGFGYRNAAFLTDSSTYESVRMRGGGSSFPINRINNERSHIFIEQNGLATWKQAITNMPTVIKKLLKKEDLLMEEIDFFIFHQANGFLIDYILKKLKIPAQKTYTNVEEIGNTGSASIGIALSEAYSKGLIKSHSNLLIAGVGAGFNFGACLFRTH